jgi:hypothetical protein
MRRGILTDGKQKREQNSANPPNKAWPVRERTRHVTEKISQNPRARIG